MARKMKRYKKIIPNYKEFKRKHQKEENFEIRTNKHKSTNKKIKKFLEKNNYQYTQRKWNKNFFKIDKNPSKTLYHWLGKYYIQEFSSGLPPMVLNPKPHDRVLDMCAAPGSKTTQISAMMKNQGEIISNDIRPERTRSLVSNLYRVGAVNFQVTERDGRNLPESPKFDKVLVDAPCSGEGDIDNMEEFEKGHDEKRIKDLSGLQEQLLAKAFRVCKEDGEIVYSTCTYAPEENESIVSKFLDRGLLKNVEFSFTHSSGITRWKDKTWPNELKNCLRIYPHQLDSGGIFIAKFKK